MQRCNSDLQLCWEGFIYFNSQLSYPPICLDMFSKHLDKFTAERKSWSSLSDVLGLLELSDAHVGVCWALDMLLLNVKAVGMMQHNRSDRRLFVFSEHLLTCSYILIPILTPTLEAEFHFSHFADQKKETQGSSVTCPKSQNKAVADPRY